MSQNAKLSLLAALVIGIAILLIWCAGGSAPGPGPGRSHRNDPANVAYAQQKQHDDSPQSATARQPPPRGYKPMRAGPPGAGIAP